MEPGENDRWSGTRGWTSEPSPVVVSFDGCPSESLELVGGMGAQGVYHRQPTDRQETEFASRGQTLAGRLVHTQAFLEGPRGLRACQAIDLILGY